MEVTRGALSQHLKGLEQHLNVRLINRTTRNMSLTEEGQRLLDVLQPALVAIEPDTEERTMVFEPKGNAVFNDDENMLSAAIQGVGLIKHLDLCVRQHLVDGRLVRVLARWCRPFPGFYLYVPSRNQMPAKTRALIDFLVERRKDLAASSRKDLRTENRKIAKAGEST